MPVKATACNLPSVAAFTPADHRKMLAGTMKEAFRYLYNVRLDLAGGHLLFCDAQCKSNNTTKQREACPLAGCICAQQLALYMQPAIMYADRCPSVTHMPRRIQDGGVRRFYRGVGPALIQGPMSRFGDTAANAGTLALLDSYDSTSSLPVSGTSSSSCRPRWFLN